MKSLYGARVQPTWRYFALEQVNSKQGPDWRLWEQPTDYPSRSIPAFLAAEAARRQGAPAHDRMHFALLEGRHERRRDFTDPADLEAIAKEAGLDIDQFRRDVADRSSLKALAGDHQYAVSTFGVFGTPTFAFGNGQTFFMRMKPPQDTQEAGRVFEAVKTLFVDRPGIDEIKRPHRPRV